jgi:predicted  nucleic acid-binding Zn-ribbon protein
MASAELMRLHKLHELDRAILQIRKRAAAMEEGVKLKALADQARAEFDAANGNYHTKHAEQRDLELANQQITDKVKSIEKQLFGGSIVNPKEIDALEHQKAGLIAAQAGNDEKILGYWDEVPKLKDLAESAKSRAEVAIKKFSDWKANAAVQKVELERRFKELSAQRPALAKTIGPALIGRYDAIRAKSQVGMADVTHEKTCEECGSAIPEMVMVQLIDDKVVVCEGCTRILYYTGGVV